MDLGVGREESVVTSQIWLTQWSELDDKQCVIFDVSVVFSVAPPWIRRLYGDDKKVIVICVNSYYWKS